MNSLFTNLSQLDVINEVILLSIRGELLFFSQPDPPEVIELKITNWNDIIASLARPLSAEFMFEGGGYYIRYTDMGYMIVGMACDANIEKVKNSCIKIQAKLADSAIRKRNLLDLLSSAEDKLKPQIIKELVPLADKEVAFALLSLLKDYPLFHQDGKEKLLLFICQALGHCSSQKAVEPLKEFLQKYKSGNDVINGDIEKAALVSIQQLEFNRPVGGEKEVSGEAVSARNVKEINTAVAPSNNVIPIKRGLPEEQRINELLENDRKSEAVALIMHLIETTARKKQFEIAEKLRDWLIQVDSMSLMEIIHAAEIIEEEKTASINASHHEVWKELATLLGVDEFASFYHCLTTRYYSKGEMVVNQGTFIANLYLINMGRVQLSAVAQGREVLLNVLGPGEIMGARTFFEASVWTINAKSMGAEVSWLPHGKLQGLEKNYPALESKLLDFCATFQSPNTLFRKTKRTRRQFERKKVSGRTTIALLDKDRKDTGIGAKGDLFDVSRGGISFCLRISQKKNATLLFGKKIRVAVPADIRGAWLSRTGLIVAVRGHHLVSNEYSIHVQFEQELSQGEVQKIVSAGEE